jgi:competence protein ComGC
MLNSLGCPMNPPTVPQPKNSPLAIWSLVFGILSLVGCSIVAGIPAVICGHMGRKRIRQSAGALGGNGLALAGLITGYVSIGLLVVLLPLMAAIAIPNFVKARDTAMRNGCINNLRLIDSATMQWALETRANDGAAVTPANVVAYTREGFPTCPAGGTYTIGPVGKAPTCSKPGHAIPH